MADELGTYIRSITGSHASNVPATTDAQLLEFINAGVRFFAFNIPDATPFLSDGSAITDSNGQAIISDKIYSARRNNRECRKIDNSLLYAQELSKTFTITVSDYANIAAGHAFTINGVKFYARASATGEEADFVAETTNDATAANIEDVIDATFSMPVYSSSSSAVVTIYGAESVTSEDATRLTVAETASTTSLHKATNLFPIFYIKTNKAYIKPDPSASAKGYVTYVSPTEMTDDDRASLDVPGSENIVVAYAASQDFEHIAHVWRDLAQTNLDKVVNASTGYLKNFEDALPTYSDPAHPDLSSLVLTAMDDLPALTLSSASDSWPAFSETLTLPDLSMPVMQSLPNLCNYIEQRSFEDANINTTDETATNAITITMEEDSALQLQIWVTGITTDGSNSASYSMYRAYKKDGSANPASIGDFTENAHFQETDSSWGGPTFDVSGNNIIVKVAGKAATNITWYVLALKTISGDSIVINPVELKSPGSLIMPTVPVLPTLTIQAMEELQTALSEADIDFTGVTSPDYSAPTAPSAITLPVLTLADMDTLPSELSEADMDFTGVSTAPSYSAPTAPSGITLPILNFDAMDTLPSALSEADIDFTGITEPSYSAPSIGTVIGSLSITNKTITDPGSLELPADVVLPTLELTDAPTFTDLDLSGISVPSSTLIYTSAGDEPDDEISLSESLPTFAPPVSPVNMGTFDTYMGTDDIEQAQVDIGKQTALINEYQADIQKELQRFNGGVSKYQAELQKEVQTAQTDVNAYTAKLQDNRNDLEAQIAQYQQDISKYQAQVNTTVQEWAQEEVQFKLQKWQSQVQSEISEYTAKAQTIISEYQANSGAKINGYNAEVNRQIQEFNVEMQADVTEWDKQKQIDIAKFNADIQEAVQSYQSEIQDYAQDVRKLVEQYNAESGSDIQKYKSNYEKLIQKFIQKNTVHIQNYQSEANAEIQRYSQDINKYQAEVQEAIQKYSNEIQYYAQEVSKAIQQYNGESESDIKKYRANYEKLIQKFLQKNTTRIQEYQNKANAEIQRYSQDISKYQAEISESIQKYSSQIQHYSVDVKKIVDQYVAESQSDIAKYQLNYQKLLEKFTRQNQTNIQEYQSKVNAITSKYSTEIQSCLGEFNANISYRIQEAQFNLSKEIQEYNAKANAYINEYQSKVTASLGEYSNKTNALINEYQSKVSSYSAQVQAYLGELNALRNSEIQEYTSKVSAYINKYSSINNVLIAEFNAAINSEIQEYSVLVNGEVSEFGAGIQKASSYLSEAQTILGAVSTYTNKATFADSQSIKWLEGAKSELKTYIAKNYNPNEQTIYHRRA